MFSVFVQCNSLIAIVRHAQMATLVFCKAEPNGFDRLAMRVQNSDKMTLSHIQSVNFKACSLRPGNCGALVDLHLESAGTDFASWWNDLPAKWIERSCGHTNRSCIRLRAVRRCEDQQKQECKRGSSDRLPLVFDHVSAKRTN
jgi:hypothetical protein